MSALPRIGVRHFRNWVQTWYGHVIQDAVGLAVRHACGLPGGIGGVQITMPPQHGKSEQVSVAAPCYGFTINPDLKVMLQTYGRDFSARAIGHASGVLNDPAHQALSPIRVGRAKSYDVDKRTGRLVETSVAAEARANMMRTLLQSPDGRIHRTQGYYLATTPRAASTGWGYDLGLLDDLVKNPEQVRNPAFRAFLLDAVKSCFFTRRAPMSSIVQVLTRWHPLDIGASLPELWGKAKIPYITIELPAIAHAEGAPRPYDTRQPGEVLDTARYGPKWYAEQQALLDDPDHWWALYQQRPRITTGASFTDDQWGRFDPADIRSGSRVQRVTISIDCNNATTTGKSNTSCDVGALVLDPQTGTLEAWKLAEENGKWEGTELLARVLRLVETWRPQDILIENAAGGPSLISHLKDALGGAKKVLEVGTLGRVNYPVYVCRGGKVRIHVIPHSNVNKQIRIETAAPYITTGRCRVPGRTLGAISDAWVPDHLREFRDWPMGAADDRLDSWGQYVIWLANFGFRPDYASFHDSGALTRDM